jgi:hypothetical protein
MKIQNVDTTRTTFNVQLDVEIKVENGLVTKLSDKKGVLVIFLENNNGDYDPFCTVSLSVIQVSRSCGSKDLALIVEGQEDNINLIKFEGNKLKFPQCITPKGYTKNLDVSFSGPISSKAAFIDLAFSKLIIHQNVESGKVLFEFK